MAKIIGIASDYSMFIDVLRYRKTELGFTCSTLDDVTGLPAGYCGKLLGSAHVRRLGPLSFELLTQALGVSVCVVEDPKLCVIEDPELTAAALRRARRGAIA